MSRNFYAVVATAVAMLMAGNQVHADTQTDAGATANTCEGGATCVEGVAFDANNRTQKKGEYKEGGSMRLGGGVMLSLPPSDAIIGGVDFVTLSDTEIFVRAKDNDAAVTEIAVEAHYEYELLPMNIKRHAGQMTKDAIICGPVFMWLRGDDLRCGFQVVATLGSTEGAASINRIGAGWSLTVAGDKPAVLASLTGTDREDAEKAAEAESFKNGFLVGFGMYYQPRANVIDYNFVDPDTMYVRPDYVDDVKTGNFSVLDHKGVSGAYFIVTKFF